VSLVVNCPSCDARVTAPHSAVGKRVKCPKCGTGIAVTDDEDDDRLVKSRRRDEDDEDDDRPRRKARRRDDDDEDEDDDRPRRKKSAGKKGGPPVILFVAIGGGLLVLGVAVVVLFVLFRGNPKGPGGVFGPSAPAGYTAVREPAGGFAVFLPGMTSKVDVKINNQDGAKLGHYGWAGIDGGSDQQVWAWSRPVPAGFNPGTDPDGLVKLLAAYEHDAQPGNDRYEVVGKRAVTLGGKPGVEVRLKQKPHLMSQPGDNGFFAERDKEETERVARDGEHHVFYVTHNGKQVFIIHVSQRKSFPADDVLKTIADSFALI
jgi:Zn-finger nucleic acid-binding protein